MTNTDKIRKRYDRASGFYDLFEHPMEIMSLKKWRLEVGVSTGKSIPYYPEGVEMTAIDFSEKLLSRD